MARYTQARNARVKRIYLIGPREEGLALARQLYACCQTPDSAPAFILRDKPDAALREQIFTRLCATALILFGPEAATQYPGLIELHPWVKVLQLLPPGAPEPEFFFSWHEQIFPWPQSDKDHRLVQAWLGLDSTEPMRTGPPFPGALSLEALNKPPQRT